MDAFRSHPIRSIRFSDVKIYGGVGQLVVPCTVPPPPKFNPLGDTDVALAFRNVAICAPLFAVPV
jgi:hypothetical protein